jgi:hypothetical protein
MKISPSMLTEYAAQHEITLNLRENWKNSEDYAQAALSLIEQESEEKQGIFWMDIDDIESMSTKEACEYLLNQLHEDGKSLDDETVEGFKCLCQQAMYFYIHHKDLFYETFDSYNIDVKQGWKGRKTDSVPLKDFIANIEDFKRALKSLYKKEYKGKKIKIRYDDKGDRVIFTAHVEDVFKTDTEFEKDKEVLNNKKPRKPVFPINFLYMPTEGVLQVKAKGGKTRVQELQNIFIKHFLKAEPEKFADISRFCFDKVQDIKNLTFPVSIQDGVESVALKGLKIAHKESLTVHSIDITPQEGKVGVQQMQEELESMNIQLEEFEIKEFKIKVVFKPPTNNKGRRRRITAKITHPDGCDLKQRQIDAVAYKLLKKWGLVLF